MVEEKTIMAIYRPGGGDPHHTTAFGRKFKAGEPSEVHERFAQKLRGNPFFAVQGEATYGDDLVQPVVLATGEAEDRANEHAEELDAAQHSKDVDNKPARRRGRPPKIEDDEE